MERREYSNLGGKGDIDRKGLALQTGQKVASGASAGKDPITIAIGAIVGAIDAAFTWGAAKKRGEQEEERYKQELIGEIYEKPKTNWTPIIVVGSVLVVAGVVTYYALKEE